MWMCCGCDVVVDVSADVVLDEGEVCGWNGMDSHGGLEVTIRQTESKKKKTTQQLRETDP